MSDMRVAELLASRICHDLVGPLGAISNGVELIEEVGGDVADEAMALVDQSSSRAAATLQLFRVAFGASGDEASTGYGSAREILDSYLAHTKCTLSWPLDPATSSTPPPRGMVKVIVNLALLAVDTIPYGGNISVSVRPLPVTTATVAAEGRGAGLSEETERALHGDVGVDALSPRTVQPYFLGRLIDQYSIEFMREVFPDDQLLFNLKFKSSEAKVS